MSVMSLRLNKEEVERISKLSIQKKEEKSTVARGLLDAGWIFYWLKLYRTGKVSLGKISEELHFSIGETLDLLAEMGIEAPLQYDDYLEGFQNLKKRYSQI